MKVYEAVARSLIRRGTRTVFGLMGDANMRYISAYLDSGTGRYVGAVHEAGAVSMADGYARITGELGVATITHGPGITNGLTALTEAARAHSPVLVITGETPRQREHLQWLDLRAAAQLAGAGYRQLQSAETAVDDLSIAMRLALATRRPFLLNVPADMLAVDTIYKESPFESLAFASQAIEPDVDQLDAALGVVASASRPLVLAGRGAVLADARDDLIGLADLIGAALATTVMAKGYFRGHPRDLGLFGTEAHSLALKYIGQADCVIAVGAGLNRYTTADGDLLANKAVVQCDSDIRTLAARHPATVAVQADARAFARAMRHRLAELAEPRPTAWRDATAADVATFSAADDFVDRSGQSTIDMRTAMMVLDEVLPAERTLVTDVGRFRSAPWRYLHCSAGGFSQTSSFGSIGLGLATAIGASIGKPDRLTVAVVGDGGLMMSMLELSTAVQHGLPMVVAVLNDGSYGAEYTKLADYGHDPVYSTRAWPSFADVAVALGARSCTVRTAEDIWQVKAALEDLTVPFLLDIKADPAASPGEFK